MTERVFIRLPLCFMLPAQERSSQGKMGLAISLYDGLLYNETAIDKCQYQSGSCIFPSINFSSLQRNYSGIYSQLGKLFSAIWMISIKELKIFQIIQLFLHMQPAVDVHAVETRGLTLFVQMTNAVVTQIVQLTFVKMYCPLQRSDCLQVHYVIDIQSDHLGIMWSKRSSKMIVKFLAIYISLCMQIHQQNAFLVVLQNPTQQWDFQTESKSLNACLNSHRIWGIWNKITDLCLNHFLFFTEDNPRSWKSYRLPGIHCTGMTLRISWLFPSQQTQSIGSQRNGRQLIQGQRLAKGALNSSI